MSALGVTGTFVGGLGLFLLGMKLMTDGLKLAAGSALRRTLVTATKTRVSALLTGAGVTALVQSSGAVTVATIGFVNAGMLTLAGAMWVIFGSNIGTTATGWLVAVTGFKFSLEALALPMAGVGIILWMVSPRKRRGAYGEFLAGLGLVFLALHFLKEAFGGVAGMVDPAALNIPGIGGIAVFALVGLVLTTLMQSSSASLAIVITAASQGVIPVTLAAAAVIGSNIGSTSTAALAVIKGTPDARRAALAHVSFNVIAAVAGFLLLPWMVPLLQALLETTADVDENVAVLLALYHTAFNVVGVILMWPLSARLERFLLRRFHSADEEESKPRHLDSSTLAVPAAALVAVVLETRRLGHLAADALRMAFASPAVPFEAIERKKASFDALLAAISSALKRINHSELSPEVSAGMQEAVHATQHLLMAAEQAIEVATHRNQPATGGFDDSPEGDPLADASSAALLALARQVVDAADPTVETVELASAHRLLGLIEDHILEAQKANLADAAMGRQSAVRVAWMQSLMREVRRGARRIVRAAEIMQGAAVSAGSGNGASAESGTGADAGSEAGAADGPPDGAAKPGTATDSIRASESAPARHRPFDDPEIDRTAPPVP